MRLSIRDADRWTFLEEGGAHAVFRYAGARPQLHSTVLRFRKGGSSRAQCVDSSRFAAAVVGRLIGSAFVANAMPCAASPELAAVLNAQLTLARLKRAAAPLRSGLIVSESGQESDDVWGMLTRDCTVGGCVAFEIKPKCGFLPSPSLRTAFPAKQTTSRFAMHQHLKLARGKVASMSMYDPLDLFSGEPARMRRALAALAATPQNNWRVWRDGARLATVPALASGGSEAGTLDALCDALHRSPLLPRLLALQRLDCCDIEALARVGVLPLRPGDAGALAPGALVETLDATLRVLDALPTGPLAGATKASCAPLSAAERISLLRGYAIAAVAKDASLLATLSATGECTLALVDVGPKSASEATFAKWAEIDRAVCAHYATHGGGTDGGSATEASEGGRVGGIAACVASGSAGEGGTAC